MEPLGKEEVDLLDVLLERGVAGGVPLDVVGGAEAFAGVEGDIRRAQLGAAMGGEGDLLAELEDGLGRGGEGAVVAGLGGEAKLREGLDAEQADDEDGADDDAGEGEGIEDAAQPLPALALGIVEDRFVHGIRLEPAGGPLGPSYGVGGGESTRWRV